MNNLFDTSTNKIQLNNREIVIQYSLYGRAKDLCERITDTELASDDGVDSLLKSVHKRDLSCGFACITETTYIVYHYTWPA